MIDTSLATQVANQSATHVEIMRAFHTAVQRFNDALMYLDNQTPSSKLPARRARCMHAER